MKRFFDRCARYRAGLCLLASGALPKSQRAGIENHLAACADCKDYYDEIKKVAMPLADWEKNFAHIEPDHALQRRWAEAVQTAGELKSARPLWPALALRTAWRELIWPCRRTWAGLAAAWIGIAVLNLSHSDHRKIVAAKSTAPPGEMRLVWQEQRSVLAEIIGPGLSLSHAEPPRRPNNQPRSQLRSVATA
jgi:anti-sigma factor RsiW